MVAALSRLKIKDTRVWLALWVLIISLSYLFFVKERNLFTSVTKDHYTLELPPFDSQEKPWVEEIKTGEVTFLPNRMQGQKINLTLKSRGVSLLNFSVRAKSEEKVRLSLWRDGKPYAGEYLSAEGKYNYKFYHRAGERVEISLDGADGHASVRLLLKARSGYPGLEYVPLLVWLSLLYFMYKKNQASSVLAFYFIYVIALLAEIKTLKTVSEASLLSYAGVCVALSLVCSFFYQEAFRRGKSWFAAFISISFASLTYLVPTAFLAYFIAFDIPVDVGALNALFQTSLTESVEFLQDYMGVKVLGFVALVVSLVSYIFWWHKKSQILVLDRSFYVFSFLLAFTMSALVLPSAKLPRFIIESAAAYQEELRAFRDIQERRKRSSGSIVATKDAGGETYIVILGESLSKKHMSLYGYHRVTTPKLDALYKAGDLLRFDNAYSNHTHTMPTLSLALTEAAQDKKKQYFDSVSIVEIFNSAGFETYWLTNQNLLGAWDNMVSAIAQESKNLIGINASVGRTTQTRSLDGDLIKHFEKIVGKESTSGNRVVFVHLMGNHGNYCNRFPKSFGKYTEGLSVSEYGSAALKRELWDRVNCYDNSVIYNDYVVGSMLEIAGGLPGKVSVLYISDHADDVLSGLGHNSAKFTYEMTQIPLVVWFSDAFKREKAELVHRFNSRVGDLFSNDRLYDTLIGWAGINTPHYRSEFDLASVGYSLSREAAVTLHGSKKYTAGENYLFWQQANARLLLNAGMGERIFPHRVNSIGKLKEIWWAGFRAFEVDLIYDYKRDGLFYVGHNDGVMGVDLETFLSSVPENEIRKIWLDLKNLNNENYFAALRELERIDGKLNIKGKAILESGWTSREFSVFRDSGWMTSYYLPTKRIGDLLEKGDSHGLADEAYLIADQIGKQKIHSISFDRNLYPFVKEFMEKNIDASINYHVRYGPSLQNPEFGQEVGGDLVIKDDRVKTLLSVYRSGFHL